MILNINRTAMINQKKSNICMVILSSHIECSLSTLIKIRHKENKQMYMYTVLVFMYIYIKICHCLFFRSNLNENALKCLTSLGVQCKSILQSACICTFKIGQGVVKLLMDHMMNITNCCLLTQNFSSIKWKKALSFTGQFVL